jgi:predicted site-specific integrase-resolvase
MDNIKIPVAASELGVSTKTIYNWIASGVLETTEPGYVSRSKAWEVFDHMKAKRVEISYFMSTYGIKRDAYGRFISND